MKKIKTIRHTYTCIIAGEYECVYPYTVFIFLHEDKNVNMNQSTERTEKR